VLEVSSHALEQERIAGLELDVAVFTNLSRDHLDYHRDMEAYAAAKERIFSHLRPGGTAVVNADDPAAARMTRAAERASARVVTYGTGPRAGLGAIDVEAGPEGSHLFLEGMGIPRTGLFLPLVGQHNIENALAAIAAVLTLGASSSRVIEGLATISTPVGRLEAVDVGERGFRVFVDYAHTPHALERVLEALRETLERSPEGAAGRLIAVFGAGGNRDREKRAPMGNVVGRLADVAVVTSDNPRDEEPRSIIEDVLQGMGSARAEIVVEEDRRKAIRRALEIARRGDAILVGGKGHETWQSSRGKQEPFEDRRVIREELP
jgi:UDP-N-acetylmuramoyl-L-alanyl-D-glutamate--2,6-diaminopimelate ligase